MLRGPFTLVSGSALALVLGITPMQVHAQDAMESGTRSEAGSLVADSGGSNNYWSVTLPEDKDVVFNLRQTNSPCLAGPGPKDKGRFGLAVTQGTRTEYSVEQGTSGCRQLLTFFSPEGGTATVEVYSYEPGFSVSYALDMVGVLVPIATPTASATSVTTSAGTSGTKVGATPVATSGGSNSPIPSGPPAGGRVR